MIKAIIFDNFGVLVTSHWEEFWGSLPTYEQQEQARELNRAYDGGHIDKQEFLSSLQQATNKSAQDIEQALFGYSDTKNNQLLDYIRTELKPKYKIGLLSNISTNWIRDELLNIEEQKLFDDMVFSFEVGITKPDPRIFELTCQRLGVELSEAILVDDIDRYCSVAGGLGMKTVEYKDFVSAKKQIEQLLANSNN